MADTVYCNKVTEVRSVCEPASEGAVLKNLGINLV